MRQHPSPTLTFAIFALAACSDGASRADVTEVDSAGVVVVTNHADPAGLPAWSLGPRALDIGVLEGDPAYQLYRVMDATRLGDGRLAVLNAGTQEVRFYDGDGAFLRSVGGDGEGPGEYRFPLFVHRLPGDSLLVYDLGLARFTVLDPDGDVGRTFLPEQAPLNEPEVAGVIGDSIVVTHEVLFSIPSTGFDTMQARVRLIDTRGRSLDSLMVPSARMGRMGGGGGPMLVGSPHFEPRTLFAAGEPGLWIGTARSAELMLRGPDVAVQRIVRWPGTAPRPITDADVAALIEQRVEDASPASRDRLRDMYEGTPANETFPAYLELQVDSENHVWVRDFTPPVHDGPAPWLVLDPDGRLVARVELPADLRILEIGRDYLLAAHTDELEVERVGLWELRR